MNEPRDYGRFPDTRSGDREYLRVRGQQLAEREMQEASDLRARIKRVEAFAAELERSSPDADDWRAVVAARLRAALEKADG